MKVGGIYITISQHLTLSQGSEGGSLAQLVAARRNGRIAVVVEDMTRHSPLEQILDVVMREIHHARVSDENVEIVFATGMHPPVRPDEAEAKLGRFARSLSWRSNDCEHRSAHVRRGTVGNVPIWIDRGVAEADLRVIVSSVSPHLQAGFGGLKGRQGSVQGEALGEAAYAMSPEGAG